MKRFVLALCLACTACDFGTVVKTDVVPMDVTRMGGPRRFSIDLFDPRAHESFTGVRLGGKRCRRGPQVLYAGRQIDVVVNTVQYRDGSQQREIDRASLTRRVCWESDSDAIQAPAA